MTSLLGKNYPTIFDFVDTLRDFYGRPLDIVSSLLRSCFIPRAGMKLVIGDFSQVEARVIAWLAGQEDILRVFASGEDVYVYTAKNIGSDNRQLGKVLVLACGFGMGASKFMDTALTYGIKLTPNEADKLVAGWRFANSQIVKFWYALDRAARQVLDGDMKEVAVGPVLIGRGSKRLAGCMLIRLPSGRHLVYRNARIKDDSITYDGVNQTTRQWEEVRTYGGKLAENVTQAVAADLLRVAMKRLSKSAVRLITTIHDEIVAETPVDWAGAGRALMLKAMTDPVPWAPGLPIGAEVRVAERYGK